MHYSQDSLLAGIIFTILLQKKELHYQIDELKETRKEFIIQNKTLQTQRFENTFFNLLSLHHQIVSEIDYTKKIEKINNSSDPIDRYKREYQYIDIKGRDVFKDKYDELRNNISGDRALFNREYLKFYKTVQTDFGHYFRNLYRIIKYINETEFVTYIELELNENIDEDRKQYEKENYRVRYSYSSMVRAQLSDYELLWLFYNCLSSNGEDKFKPLVEKYTLLKNYPQKKLKIEEWYLEYDSSAFNKES